MISHQCITKRRQSSRMVAAKVRWQAVCILNILAMLFSSVGFVPQSVNAAYQQTGKDHSIINETPLEQTTLPNDMFENAELLTTIPYRIYFNVSDATSDESWLQSPCAQQTGGKNIWYKFIPPEDGEFSLDVSSLYGTIVTLWVGLDLVEPTPNALICDDTGDAPSQVMLNGGETYWIEVRQIDDQSSLTYGTVTLEPVYQVEESLLVEQGLKAVYTDQAENEVIQLNQGVIHDWLNENPVEGISSEGFQVSISGFITIPEDDEYIFYLNSNGGSNLWIDGNLLLEHSVDEVVSDQVTITLTGGLKYAFQMDFFDKGENASINLEWSSSTILRESIPYGNLSYVDLTKIVANVDCYTGEECYTELGDWISLDFQTWFGAYAYYENIPMYAMFDQGGWLIDEEPAESLAWIPLGSSDKDYYTYLQSVSPGIVHVRFRLDEYVLTQRSTVNVNSGVINGLFTEYFNGEEFGENPEKVEIQREVSFEFQFFDSPITYRNDPFSVKWSTRFIPQTDGPITFYVQTNDAVRLWVDDQLLVDDWTSHTLDWKQGTINLTAGIAYDIRIEYYSPMEENSYIQIDWESEDFEREILSTENFSYIDFDGTNTNVDKQIAAMDGVDEIQVSVNLKNRYDRYIPNQPMEVQISGTGNSINGVPVTQEDWVQITDSTTDTSSTFMVTSTDSGIKKVLFRTNGYILPVEQQFAFEDSQNYGLTAFYFANKTLTPPALVLQSEYEISHDWGLESPIEGMSADNFSVRWVGKIRAPQLTEPEEFTFYSLSDDGVRLWIDGNLIIDSWINQTPIWYSGTYVLDPEQTYDFVLEYYEQAGEATIQLEWGSASTARSLISGLNFLKKDLSSIQVDFNYSPLTVPASGDIFGTVSLSLFGINNEPIENEQVYVNVSESGNKINGNEISNSDWILIDETETPGFYSFDLSSTIPGEKQIRVKLGNFPLNFMGNYLFVVENTNLGLLGKYYANNSLQGSTFVTVENQVVDFNWGEDSPVAGIPADEFSVRWTGTIQADYTEIYTFHTHSDDGIRIWLDGDLVIDSWEIGVANNAYEFVMTAGVPYEIVIEYFEQLDAAEIQLEWESPSIERQVIPIHVFHMAEIPDYQIDLTATPDLIDANGIASTEVSVSVADAENNPVEETVYVRISGENVVLDGTLLDSNVWYPLSVSEIAGLYTGHITSMSIGEKTIEVRVGNYQHPDKASVQFIRPVEEAGLRVDSYISDPSNPYLTHYGEIIDYVWGQGNYSHTIGSYIRWTGRITPELTGTYIFYFQNDTNSFLNINGQDINSGASIQLEAGIPISVIASTKISRVAEGVFYFYVRWTRPDGQTEVVPLERLSYLDMGGTTASIDQSSIPSGGTTTTNITVEAKRANGQILSDRPVRIMVSGTGNTINGELQQPGQFVEIGLTDDEGKVTVEIASLVAEVKNVFVLVDGMLLSGDQSFTVTPVNVNSFLILLDGEILVPGSETGKTGSGIIFKGDPVVITFVAVDATYNLAHSVSGQIGLNLSDVAAMFPAEVTLQNGVGQAVITWGTLGSHSIQVTGIEELAGISGTENISVTDTLEISSGQTVYLDEVRTTVAQSFNSGATSIVVTDSTGFYAGQEIIIYKVSGQNAGDYTVTQIENVQENVLALQEQMTDSFDIESEKASVTVIPSIDHLIIHSGGVLTANAWNGQTGGVLYLDMANLTVEEGGAIHADGKGFRLAEGPGAPQGSGGGSYGGYGAATNNVERSTYGDVRFPNLFGSGGSTSRGGGLVLINVENESVINGQIRANGFYGSGSGSGGSVFITSDVLNGSGKIMADGGYSDTSYGDPGSGGRVALKYNSSIGYTGQIEAYGYNESVYTISSGPGTIYIENTGTGENELIVKNRFSNLKYVTSANSKPYATLILNNNELVTFDEIRIESCGHLEINGNGSTQNLYAVLGDNTSILSIENGDFNLDQNDYNGFFLKIKENATLFSEDAIELSNMKFDNYGTLDTTGLSLIGSEFTNYGSLSELMDLSLDPGTQSVSKLLLTTTGSSINVVEEENEEIGHYTFDQIRIAEAQRLQTGGNLTTGTGITISANTMNIAGIVETYNAGYTFETLGPGAPTDIRYGAGHGGKGGGSAGGDIYGSYENPVTLGSSSGTGYGGGAIHLIVNELLYLAESGVIQANGTSGYLNGGDSGGSIWIDAQSVTGQGAIQAQGSNGGNNTSYYGGGGGRIAILADTIDARLLLNANGGTGLENGEPGTIYTNQFDAEMSSLIVSKTDAIANGIDQISLTITLVNSSGDPLPDKPVEIAISDGAGLEADITSNNDPVAIMDQYVGIGTTNQDGQVTAILSTTVAGERKIVARSSQQTLNHIAEVNFTAGAVSLNKSAIWVTPEVPADGISTGNIIVHLVDEFENPVQNQLVTIVTDGEAILESASVATDTLGNATTKISDIVVETVNIQVMVNEQYLTNTASVRFRGSDMVFEINPRAQINGGYSSTAATTGYPMTIDVTVWNNGGMTTSGVQLDVAVPDAFNYSSGPDYCTYDSETSSLMCSMPNTYAPRSGSSFQLLFDVLPGFLGSYTTTFDLITMGGDEDPNNKHINLNTSVSAAMPQITIIREANRLGVLQGHNKSETIIIKNTGTATLLNPTITYSGLPNWASIYLPLSLPNMEPDAEIPVTVVYNTFSDQSVGVSQWNLSASGSEISPVTQPVEVEVVLSNLTKRSLVIKLLDGENPISGNSTVILTPQNLINTQLPDGTTVSYQPTQAKNTDQYGAVSYADLEPGTYKYEVISEDYEYASDTFSVQPGDTDQVHQVQLTSYGINYSFEVVEIPDGVNIRYEIHLVAEYVTQKPMVNTPGWCTAEIGCTWWIVDGTGYGLVYDALDYKYIPDGSWSGGLIGRGAPRINYRRTYMTLSQEVMLSWQAFNAGLYLENANLTPVDDLSIELNFTSMDGTDRSADFVVENQSGEIPTTLAPGADLHNNWMILPTGNGITDPEGEDFIVTAAISFMQNGETVSFTTLPQVITVHPAPDLKITYTLPPSDDYCSLFDLTVNIQNVGFGPARNLTLTSGKPGSVLVCEGSGCDEDPVEFTLEEASLENSPIQPVFQMNFGTLEPGESKTGFWRISASDEVKFISFEGVLEAATPVDAKISPISALVTNLSPGACLRYGVLSESTRDSNCDNCNPIQGTQGSVGGPINTLTGVYDYSQSDLSIQTAYGIVELERWYSTAAINRFDYPFSSGWTHSLEKHLNVMPGLAWLKLRSTNEYKFWMEENSGSNGSGGISLGEPTFTPYPGFFGSLTYSIQTQSYTLIDQNKVTLTFDQGGNILSEINEQGIGIYYIYDPENGRLQRVEDHTGTRYLELLYDSDGALNEVSDHTDRSVTYDYDTESGDLTTFTDAAGKIWTYEYDEDHLNHLAIVRDPLSHIVERTVYDDLGRAVRQYDGTGALIVDLDFSESAHTVIEDVFGNQSLHRYNAINTLVAEENALSQQQTKTYDGQYRPTTITDATGTQTTLTWSADGKHLTGILDGLEQPTVLEYDPAGNLSLLRDAQGNESEFFYTGSLLTSNTDALDNTTTYVYTTAADESQPAGLLKSTTDELGHTSTYTYDQHAQLISTTNHLGQMTTYRYDDLGRMIAQTSFDGRSNWNCYDALDRVVRSVENASGDGNTPQSNPCDVENYIPSTDQKYDRVSERVYDDAGNLIISIDSRGMVTRTYYDSANRPITTVRNLQNWDRFSNDLPPVGIRTSTENLVTETKYDAAGNVIASIGLDGRIMRTYYDVLGRPEYSVTNLTGQEISVLVPPAVRGKDTNVTSQNIYDKAGNLIASVDLVPGCEISKTTGGNGETIITATAACRVTRIYYDALNRVIAVVQNLSGQAISDETIPSRGTGTSDMNLRSDSQYDKIGNLIATTDPAGSISRTYYDALQRAEFTVENLSNWTIGNESPPPANLRNAVENITTQMIYDESGNLIASVDPLGVVSRTWYDELNRPAQSVTNLKDPAAPSATLEELLDLTAPPAYDQLYPDWNVPSSTTLYDDLGRSVGSIDPLGHINRTYYDVLQRPLQSLQNVVDLDDDDETIPAYDENTPDQNVPGSQIVYDDDGRQIASINPLGIITRTYYDDLGRAWLTVYNLSGQTPQVDTPPTFDPQNPLVNIRTETIYNAAGQAIASKDTYGRINRTYFDGLNRPVIQVQNLVVPDVQSNTPPTYDPNFPDQNIRTETVYDNYGQVIASIAPDGSIQRNFYDKLGRVIVSVINLQGQAIEVETVPVYDPQDAEHIDQNVPTYLYYDLAGNLVNQRDAKGVVTHYEYDTLNRLTAVVENYLPPMNPDNETNLRTEYGYDANGSRLTIRNANATLNDTQYVTSFVYDALGRQVSESDPLGNTWTVKYNILGQRLSTTDANGASIQYIYDAIGRLDTINYPEPQADVDFDYDIASRRVGMADGVGDTVWAYDDLGRVESVTDANEQTVGYAYDALGNRTGITYADSKQVNYAFDALYRLARVSDWQAQETVYDYDINNRLSAVNLPNGVVSSYLYDELGRLETLVHQNNTTTISSFNYAYDAVGNRTQVIEQQLVPGAHEPYVSVMVKNTSGIPQQNMRVIAYKGTTNSGYSALTDENGNAQLVLPFGDYRFRVMVNNTIFWSGAVNHCHVEGCHNAEIIITESIAVLVQDNLGNPVSEATVQAFSGEYDTGYTAISNNQGYAYLTLPVGDYRFLVEYNNASFWSDSSDSCSVPGCISALITVAQPIRITVVDTEGVLVQGARVYAYHGTLNTGVSGLTNASGEVRLSLNDGDYRFKVKYNGTYFWSGESNHCTIPGCNNIQISVSHPTTITVLDTNGLAQAGMTVHAYQNGVDTGLSALTNSSGQALFTLLPGDYRFMASDATGSAAFWSDGINLCSLPGCTAVNITVNPQTTISVLDENSNPLSGLTVTAYTNNVATSYQAVSDGSGNALLRLADGSYRFMAQIYGQTYWSSATEECTVPGCVLASIQENTPQPTPTPSPTPQSTSGRLDAQNGLKHVKASIALNVLQQSAQVTVQVNNTSEIAQPNVFVRVFDGDTFMGISGQTDANGQVVFTLDPGSYRFRADVNGTRFWSSSNNGCTIPGCTNATITVSEPITVSVQNTDGTPQAGMTVVAYNGTTSTGIYKVSDVNGQAVFTLPTGSYRFQTAVNNVAFWSGTSNHCTIPGCTTASITVTKPVTVTLQNTAGTPQVGAVVIAFNGSTNTGISQVTDSNGQVHLTLPTGSYRFRATIGSTRFWSDTVNHCTVPGCETAQITIPGPIPVTVVDSDGTPQVGLPVYAFNGTTYANVSGITDSIGRVTLTLPDGSYRFQSELNGVQFWSDTVNHCTVPGCSGATILVTKPLTVHVVDTQAAVRAGLTVRIYNDTTYTGSSGITDENGDVHFTLPQGSYRVRVDYNEAQFYSGASNHCTLPGCELVSVTVNVPVTVSVVGVDGSPFEGITVELYKEDILQTNDDLTDENGAVLYTLNDGVYQFAANLSNTRFWSNQCSMPGCAHQTIVLPGGQGSMRTTSIDYEYDPLYRLTEANYNDGSYYHYEYDSVGNRLTETTQDATKTYAYDIANRLTSVDGVSYTWDNNGNLMNDGTSAYTYDYNNKLVGLTQGTNTYGYAYTGMGDRIQQIVNGVTTDYVLDINSGLTQVLQDGTNTYLYGINRVAQSTSTQTEYFLGDALGSVRNLVDSTGAVTLTQSYTPYGEVLTTSGTGVTDYAYTGEMYDAGTGLVFLRARYYSVGDGRFISRDIWNGLRSLSQSQNRWAYVINNPIRYYDPSGLIYCESIDCNFGDTPIGINLQNATREYALTLFSNVVDDWNWSDEEIRTVNMVIRAVSMKYAKSYNIEVLKTLIYKSRCNNSMLFNFPISPTEAFLTLHGGKLEFKKVNETENYWGMAQTPRLIHFYRNAQFDSDIIPNNPSFVSHEVGHTFELAMDGAYQHYKHDNEATNRPSKRLDDEGITDDLWDRHYGVTGERYGGFADKYGEWQWSEVEGGFRQEGYNADGTPYYVDGRPEVFADMFSGWLFNRWGRDREGNYTSTAQLRADYMNDWMPKWIVEGILMRKGLYDFSCHIGNSRACYE
ncbi:MAG: hypothetical protein CVU39_07585 [Chloroflexi bacterium HGW-Chloroflexi-10]|nr:MAG: hypothetical protein CVU39_07585 [Chloroflexi bacterium HGW-Chloroflexi-10]